MLLSRLEISGFKSFPERTVIEFDGGITGVVGPNGCGKSNILDSIRWVLGEQRSSVLRSSRMEEIIFSGTSQLKPTGMAEVSLLIKNNRGLLPIAYNDVIITRRLYRSGESEYLLNKNQCRLKDIIELFFDTGIGPHAYSVIQQGMIDAILSDRTEDRRYLFEEAAGVTRYKYRKRETENKLVATEADLLRIGDVIGEIEKQVVSLRRQARKAERYTRHKLQLKNVEKRIAAARLFDSEKKYNEIASAKQNLQADIEAVTAGLRKYELNLQEFRLGLLERERKAVEIRQADSAVTVEAAAVENDINLARQRSETASREIEKSNDEIRALENRLELLNRDLDDKQKRLEEIRTQKDSLVDESESVETELENASRDLTVAETDLEKTRVEHSRVVQKGSALDAEIASLEEMNEDLHGQAARLDVDARGYDSFRDEASEKIKTLEEKRKKIAGEIGRSRENRARRLNEIAELDDEITMLRDELSALKAEYSGLSARKELLQQLIRSGEGYSSGAGALLQWADKPEGMLMPIAEVMEVAERFRVAVSAALGDMNEIVPVRTRTEAESAISYLQACGGGRVNFLVLEGINVEHLDDHRPEATKGFIGFLGDLVSFPEPYRPAVRLLLGRIGLFESGQDAAAADGDWRHFSRVSLDGTVYSPPAFISGGRIAPTIPGRQRDSDELREKLESLGANISAVENTLNAKLRIAGELKGDLRNIENDLSGSERTKEAAETELGQMKLDFQEKENAYSSAVTEAGRIGNEIDHYKGKLERSRAQRQSLEADIENSSAALAHISHQTDKKKQLVREIEGRLTRARIRNVELDGLAARMESEIEHGRELIGEAGKMIASNRDNISRAEKTKTESTTAIEDLKKSLDGCFDRRNILQEKLREAEGAVSEYMIEIRRLENEISNKRQEKDNRTSALHRLEMEFLDVDSSRKAIVDRFSLEFGDSHVDPAPIQDDETIDSLMEKSDSIRLSLKRMEPVNLMAAEDYERENDRLNFLVRQREDLLEARTSLKAAIIRINTTAEKRFLETFKKIGENFQTVFDTLFEGGEAGVALENPDDPLDSPIRISARPGGKKMLAVTQLSGGERALTAISLLFSIYLVKPSPFCILDEVDAPLDDANLLRFLKLIKKFAESTQFIIITHNKLTMEASDILYGVTMQSPGVSRIVSVKFGGNGDGLEDHEDVK